LDGLEGIEVIGADVGEWSYLDSLQLCADLSQSKLLLSMITLAKSQC
jgi:hypothetical protein